MSTEQQFETTLLLMRLRAALGGESRKRVACVGRMIPRATDVDALDLVIPEGVDDPLGVA